MIYLWGERLARPTLAFTNCNMTRVYSHFYIWLTVFNLGATDTTLYLPLSSKLLKANIAGVNKGHKLYCIHIFSLNLKKENLLNGVHSYNLFLPIDHHFGERVGKV